MTEVWATIDDALDSERAGAGPAAILIDSGRRSLPSGPVLQQLRARFPATRLVLVGETCDVARMQEAMEAEIDGFLVETTRPEVFSKALELIVFGERIYPVPQMRQILVRGPEARGQADSSFEELSPSQMQVLALLANAYPNKLIARELGISESTVKVHVKAILRKTGARNRTDVALRARGLAAEGHEWVEASEQPSAEMPEVGAKSPASGGLARDGEGYVEDLQLRRQELQYRARRGREQGAVLRG